MKIVKLEAENVKRLRAVEIVPEGNVVTIRGNNAQGKTSVLDSIQLALGGKSVQPPKVIREGEDNAKVVVDLGELVVERRWTSNDRSYLDVRSRDGAKFGSPQAMLDKLVGSLSFDPLSFLRLEPKKQLDLLRSLTGVDTTDLDAEARRVYDERTLVNRELERAKARLPEPTPLDGPDAEVSAASIIAEQQAAQAQLTANQTKRGELAQAQLELQTCRSKLAAAYSKAEALEKQLAEARKAVEALAGEVDMAHGAIEALGQDVAELPPDPDMTAFAKRLAEIESVNAKVRAKKERVARAAEVSAKSKEADALTARLQEIAAAKEERIKAAKVPVDGLGFGSDGITYGGLPFEQASSAEQLRVSLAMGLALNPKLKVLLIRDGSLLDEQSMVMVSKMAAEAGAQVWVEVVGRTGPGLVIEDGQVVE